MLLTDMALEKLIVIGSSCGGDEACKFLVPDLELDRAAVVIHGHIHNDLIYNNLKEAKRHNVVGIEDGVEVKEGNVYAFKKNPLWNIRINFNNGFIKLYKKKSDLDYLEMDVDCLMKNAASSYKERYIGVILSGVGDDGSEGASHIKKAGGKVLVQTMGATPDYNYINFAYYMPNNAKLATKVNFAGPVEEIAKMINSY